MRIAKTGWRTKLGSHLLFIATAFIVWIVIGLILFTPATTVPKQADALMVLAPAGERLVYAQDLMNDGLAETLVISVPRGHEVPVSDMCNASLAYEVICFAPDPVTTQGEARALQTLAKQHGWTNVAVLTGRSHMPRADVILRRCFQGDLNLVAQPQALPLLSLSNPKGSWAYQYVYETAATLKAIINSSC